MVAGSERPLPGYFATVQEALSGNRWAEGDLDRGRFGDRLRAALELPKGVTDFAGREVTRRCRQFVIAVEVGLRGRQLTRRARAHRRFQTVRRCS
jgi:hypothetical protein